MPEEPRQTVTVTLFTVPECAHCTAGRAYLEMRAVPFVERDVAEDRDALADMLFLVGRAEVPVLYVGYRAVVGFDEEAWDAALAHGEEMTRGDPFALPPELGEDPLKL